jgi:pyruvate formate-lyase/glycerol dehydratase family glycyl radical enzyme
MKNNEITKSNNTKRFSVTSVSQRVAKLRENLLSSRVEIDIERARLLTDFWKISEDIPLIIRKAKALEYILNNMSIHISEGELIVGNQAKKDRASPIFPEYAVKFIKEELDGKPYYLSNRPVDPYFISEEDTVELKEICRWWEGKTLYDHLTKRYPKDVKKVMGMGITQESEYCGIGHILINYPKLIKNGLNGIIKEAQKELNSLDITNPENILKDQFYQAIIICCNAAIEFGRRYSVLAREQSKKEFSSQRKKELSKIEEVCGKVPGNPPSTFLEAIQSVWFIQLIQQIDDNGHSISLGRFDQYIYPFYEKEIREGRITIKQAIEILECFLIKMTSINKLRSYNAANYSPGYVMYQNLTIGGLTKDGIDATNELSYLILKAVKNIKLVQPSVSIRLSKKTQNDFLIKCCECLNEHRGGQPVFYNDEVAVSALTMTMPEASKEESYNWAVVGCAEPSKGGSSFIPALGQCFSLLKILELTLNNGKDPKTGIQLLPNIGDKDLELFDNFNELLDAYKRQLKYYIKLSRAYLFLSDMVFAERFPHPFASLLNANLKKGKDLTAGGADYNGDFILLVGIANVVNSLVSIKKLVFVDKKIKRKQLKHALDTNFEDINTIPTGDEIRQILKNKAPKYGNDDDSVDLIAREIISYISKYNKSKENKTYRGGSYLLSLVTVTANVPMGVIVGATPDGRKAKEPTNDGSSPTQGTDIKGPTASMKSVAKIDYTLLDAGTVYNMKFDPALFEDPEIIHKFAMMIKTFFSLGGFQLQVNIISNEILKEAQKKPEMYRDLMVRVTGYSAQFVSLSAIIQNDIIRRTEHKLI